MRVCYDYKLIADLIAKLGTALYDTNDINEVKKAIELTLTVLSKIALFVSEPGEEGRNEEYDDEYDVPIEVYEGLFEPE